MRKIIVVVLAAMFLLPFTGAAQALKGSYFLDNSAQRNQMNPAFAPRTNYVMIPAVGDFGLGLLSNLDIATFLYPMDGQLATFLHPSVTVEQFDRALAKHPHLDAEFGTNLVNFGFYTKRGSFWTFDLSLRTGLDVDLPRDLFMFMKKGTGLDAETFNIANINAYATAAVTASLGYSRKIGESLRVGARVRFIAPVAYAELNLDNVRLMTGKEKWEVKTDGSLHAVMHGLDISMPENGYMPDIRFDLNRLVENKVLAGYGGSIDLGVEWKLNIGSLFDGLSVSASVTDLGWIQYKKGAQQTFATQGSFVWDGFQDVDQHFDFNGALDEVLDDAKALMNIEKKEDAEQLVRSTMPRVYAGVEVPFCWDRMSAGLLYSGRFSHSYYRQELTASYNLKAFRWLSLGVNYSFLNTAKTIGWILEVTPKAGMNFFIGGDYLPAEWVSAPILDGLITMPDFLVQKGHAHPYLPMSYRFNLHFGMSVAF